MANSHANQLVVASDEEGMLNLLRLVGHNVAAHVDAGSEWCVPEDASDARGLTSATDLQDAWCDAAPLMDGAYPCVFNEGSMVGLFEAQEYGEDASGRPLGDTATVSLARYGKRYVLFFAYSTAWATNDGGVRDLLSGLPQGAYGFALFDSDEDDGYSTVRARCSSTDGPCGRWDGCWKVPEGFGDGWKGAPVEQVARARDGLAFPRLSKAPDLEQLALACSLVWWQFEEGVAFPQYSPGPKDDGAEVSRERREPSAGEFWMPRGPDMDERFALVGGLLRQLPFWASVVPTRSKAKLEKFGVLLEELVPYDPVVVTSTWKRPAKAGTKAASKPRQAVELSVSLPSGERLGRLELFNENRNACLALLLGHVKAHLASVVPPSQLKEGKGPYAPEAKVALEFDGDIDAKALACEVSKLLSRPFGDRSLSSICRDLPSARPCEVR